MLEPIIREHANGGKGRLIIQPILSDAELGNKCRLYARVTIPVGSSMGLHTHSGDGETREVGPGDATFCADGHNHAIENIGDTDLVLMALIIYSDK